MTAERSKLTRLAALRRVVEAYEGIEAECWRPEQRDAVRNELADVLEGLDVTAEEQRELGR